MIEWSSNVESPCECHERTDYCVCAKAPQEIKVLQVSKRPAGPLAQTPSAAAPCFAGPLRTAPALNAWPIRRKPVNPSRAARGSFVYIFR
jgi:hypothetical protein